jgi:hypothetical protein
MITREPATAGALALLLLTRQSTRHLRIRFLVGRGGGGCALCRVTFAVKKRRTFMIEPEILEKLRAIKDRTGLSESEQVRQGIQWWLESREWPVRRPERSEDQVKPKEEDVRARKRR